MDPILFTLMVTILVDVRPIFSAPSRSLTGLATVVVDATLTGPRITGPLTTRAKFRDRGFHYRSLGI